jgi:hypothetical protein
MAAVGVGVGDLRFFDEATGVTANTGSSVTMEVICSMVVASDSSPSRIS